ncbi:MAG: Isoleucine--tRNA ligase [bacterium ADurb.Bin478]|nr:MAG: Isoleucine--tRNA ligase [bacterium ADurb.Bin478]
MAVETLLTEELTYEGLAREFVNRVQNMRKESKFEVTDRISIWLTASAPFIQAVERMRDYVSHETLCESLRYNETGGTHQKEWKIDEESISVGIARI